MSARSSSSHSNNHVDDDNPFRVIPPLSSLLEEIEAPEIEPRLRAHALRRELDRIRSDIEAGARPTSHQVRVACQSALDALLHSRLDEVINGTGIVLHTNLGRAPVSQQTAEAMSRAAGSYVSLEIDPETNRRGGRMDEVSRLMRLLTGAEATLVVNNNAAAVLLTLAALCAGREVIVSRGEAVEIGGGFRIPEVVAQSGCRLIEVGTTNRTYVSDFVRVVTECTGAFLRVHPSNFRIEGFTAVPTTEELAIAARDHGTILIEDLGSGALIDTTLFGLRKEPTIAEVIGAGAAVVTSSADKLLGGPQAGFICGNADVVRKIERHPLARALRADKTALAGIAATLRHYLCGEAETHIPIWQMIAADVSQLEGRAKEIATKLDVNVVSSVASVGGGSLPGETLPSVALELVDENPDALARRLRTGTPRVFPIIRDDAVLVDMRTVLPRQDESLWHAIRNAQA